MKSRQKFTVSEKNYAKKSESEGDNSLESRVKKKIGSNPLLLKNLNFLQTYNNLFRKPAYQTGDSDAYFKQSLRNKHEPFDLIRDLNLGKHLVKSVKSLESINKRKQRSKRTLLSPKELPKRHSYTDLCLEPGTQIVIKELYSLDQKEESESDAESDEKGYFSPPNEVSADLEDVEEVSEEDPTPKTEEPLEEKLEEKEEQEIEPVIMEAEEFAGEGEDEMKAVGDMIDQAAEELEQVAADHQNLMDTIQGTGEGGSIFKFDPKIDAAVLKELEAAEKQAKETAKIINELKARVAELLEKEKMTEAEARELEQKNKQLKAQMMIFEEKTRRIQALIAQSNLFEKMLPIKPTLQKKQPEDMLPKIILCGLTGQNIMPDDRRTCHPRFAPPMSQAPAPPMLQAPAPPMLQTPAPLLPPPPMV